MATTKIGFIGAGDISLLHADALRECPEAELVGLWNITDDLAREKSEKFGCKIYPTAEALMHDPEIDAVFVLTALEAHHKYTMMALEAGKHVLVEKPVGATVREIEEMRDKARENNVYCVPGHNYIHEEGIQRSRDLIQKGKLGDIASVYVMYNIYHPEEVAARNPGVIRHIMTHHSYIMLYLIGQQPLELAAMKSVIHYKEITQEDLAMVTVRLQNQALVHFCASFATDDHSGDPWTVMVKVIGTKGAIRYSYRDWVENTPATVHSQTYHAYPYTINNEVRYFVHNCLKNGQEPLSGLDDAIIAQKMIEASERSANEGVFVRI